MAGHLRKRFWVELALATGSGVLLVLTLLWHDWIERVSPLKLDGGDGSLEWGLAVGCLLVTASAAYFARGEWGRARDLVTP